jgi:uracil-DNA glycosylase family 4
MIEKPQGCKGCVLYGRGVGFSHPSGRLGHNVGLVGEALGQDEEIAGVPFVGRAGQQLRRMVERLADPASGTPLRFEDFRLYNTLWCRPPNNEITGTSYEMDALQHCAPILEKHLKRERPRVLVALGNQAMRRLTGHWGVNDLRGYYFDTPLGLVIPTYHPSFIMRGKFELSRVFQLDLIKAIKAASGERFKRSREYILHPSPQQFLRWIEGVEANPGAALAFDIETPYGGDLEKDSEWVAIEDEPTYTILRISFAYEEGRAISVPWSNPFVDLCKRLLRGPNPKVGWNSTGFDVPRLVANGAVLGGSHYDAMHMWHALEPSLPMGLKYVGTFYCPDMPPWKLRAREQPEWYNAADSDVTICCYNGIRKSLETQQRWAMYEKHFVEVDTVLRQMSARGIFVDRERRAANREHFQERFKRVVEDAQPYYPLELRRKKTYTYSEERLKKQGLWEEGAMVKVEETGPVPDKYEVGPDGFLVRKKKEKKNGVRSSGRKGKPKVQTSASGTGRKGKDRGESVRPEDAVCSEDDSPGDKNQG